MKPYNHQEAKASQVRRMFDAIAPRYDLLNHLLSLGIDRGWRRRTVKAVGDAAPQLILDVATGTGDLAIALAKAIPQARITGADISEGMIEVGRQKVERLGLGAKVALTPGDASDLPFGEGSYDAVTAAFGVRNFEDLQAGIAGMHRVMRRGGTLAILEFSTPRSKVFGALYNFYFHKILPLVGGWISGDKRAYAYLPSSVREFPSPGEFSELIARTGFTNVRARSLTGGVAYLYTAIKE